MSVGKAPAFLRGLEAEAANEPSYRDAVIRDQRSC